MEVPLKVGVVSADSFGVGIRRSSGGRIDRRTADLFRGVLLYGLTAVVAGVVGWLIVLLSASTA